MTEGSRTTNLGTDPASEDRLNRNRIQRHKYLGKQAHNCDALRIPKGIYVDTAGIERKKMSLPGEISTAT